MKRPPAVCQYLLPHFGQEKHSVHLISAKNLEQAAYVLNSSQVPILFWGSFGVVPFEYTTSCVTLVKEIPQKTKI